jgi:hypothetical protein
MRAEAAAAHAHPDANPAAADPMLFEHAMNSNGPNETERPEQSIVTRAAHRQTKLLGPLHVGGLDIGVGCNHLRCGRG